MYSIPAHKQTDPDKKPGQIKNDVVLSDYIERVLKEETPKKKLTFDEWWNSGKLSKNNPYRADSAAWWALEGWRASRENK